MKYSWFTRIDITDIVSSHLKSLVNTNTSKPEFSDFFIFLIIPLAVAVILPLVEVFFNENIVNIVITSLSIFVGLFFNVIVLIITTMCHKKDEIKDQVKERVIKEIIDNISYTILISLITIVSCIFASQECKVFHQIMNGLCYFLLVHFLMTLLLVLKRVYRLFTYQLEHGV